MQVKLILGLIPLAEIEVWIEFFERLLLLPISLDRLTFILSFFGNFAVFESFSGHSTQNNVNKNYERVEIL